MSDSFAESHLGVSNVQQIYASLHTCAYCQGQHTGMCPRVKSVEYNDYGQIIRVEFWPPPGK